MPEQFGTLTLRELFDLYAGYKWRQERDELQRAEMARWILSGHTKKIMDPFKAINRKKKRKERNDQQITPEQKKAFFKEHDKMFPKVIHLKPEGR